MASFGETLRRERELRGIELREVSDATKIPLRYLEALERNDFTFLPGGVHTRNFVRLCSQYIGADDNEMVNAYLYEINLQSQKGPTELGEHPAVISLRRHFQVAKGGDDRRRRRARIAVILVLFVFLLGLIAGGAFLVARMWTTPSPASPVERAAP